MILSEKEKRELGRERLEALRSMHGDGVMLQMVIGVTAGMLDLMPLHRANVGKLWRFIGAMREADWRRGVSLTVRLVQTDEGN